LGIVNLPPARFQACSRANRKVFKNEHAGKAEMGSEMPTEVNSLCPNPPLLIALHSPHVFLETGLRLSHPEKSRDTNTDLS
jgi:hypothetical protein